MSFYCLTWVFLGGEEGGRGGTTCIHGTITFSEGSGLILGAVGILNMDWALFYWFNSIWETEV